SSRFQMVPLSRSQTSGCSGAARPPRLACEKLAELECLKWPWTRFGGEDGIEMALAPTARPTLPVGNVTVVYVTCSTDVGRSSRHLHEGVAARAPPRRSDGLTRGRKGGETCGHVLC